jgi:hypothetical protein
MCPLTLVYNVKCIKYCTISRLFHELRYSPTDNYIISYVENVLSHVRIGGGYRRDLN